jgi:hypothetical protein
MVVPGYTGKVDCKLNGEKREKRERDRERDRDR